MKRIRPIYVRNAAQAPSEKRIEILWNAGPIHDGRTNYQTDIWGYPAPQVLQSSEPKL